jgi:hypothetical protein
MSKKSFGQAAYEAWCGEVNPGGSSSIEPLHLKPWDKLPERARKIWDTVAQAVLYEAALVRGNSGARNA